MVDTRILVVDDEEVVRESCRRGLEEAGHRVETAEGGMAALALLQEHRYDLLLVDLKMPGMGGMELLQRVREAWPETDVLIVTGYSTVETAVQAMKLGAYDYLCKPFAPDELSLAVSKIVEKRRLHAENRYLQEELWSRYHLKNIVGVSPAMQEVFRLIARIAPTNGTVLILGESGVGKELAARAIHFNSLRREKRFVTVDCAGMTETLLESELFGHVKGAFTGAVAAKDGLFKVADGGTVFLDEVGNIPTSIQAKLLRVLQEREFRPVGGTETIKADIRLIAATNRDLEQMIRDREFREDLYYRLNIIAIRVPPLRERVEDIPPLAHHFLKKHAVETGGAVKRISTGAMNVLIAHDWPGNARELENAIHRAVILCNGEVLDVAHLPPEVRRVASPDAPPIPSTNDQLKEAKKVLRSRAVEEVERAFILDALRKNGWNVTRAAAEVGMLRPNFQALMKKHAISARRGGTEE